MSELASPREPGAGQPERRDAVGDGLPQATRDDPFEDAERTTNRIRLALVAAGLLSLASLALLFWPMVETIYSRGEPAGMHLFDLLIRVSAAEAPSKAALIFASVVVALLTLLIAQKIDTRWWNFIAFSAVASIVGAVYLYIYADRGFLSDQFGSFKYPSRILASLWESGDTAGYEKEYNAMYASLKTAIAVGGAWNVFVLVSMVKNKVASGFLKRIFGIEL